MGRIESFIWYMFLFALPFQARIMIFQWGWQFSEWQSVSVYGTDILLGILLVWWIKERRRLPRIPFGPTGYALVVFFVVACISVKNATLPLLGLFQLAKLAEGALLFFYVRHYAARRFDVRMGTIVFLAGAVFQSGVAIAQFLLQHSVGLRLFGESVISPAREMVAVFYNSSGDKVMRAYGLTPHPNVLAACLLVALFVGCAFYAVYQSKVSARRRLCLVIPYAMLVFAFLFTFSRTVIFAWAATGTAVFLWFAYAWRHRRPIAHTEAGRELLIVTVVLCIAFAAVFWPDVKSRVTISPQEEAVRLRIRYVGDALGSGAAHINLLGVGFGNFVPWLRTHDTALPREFLQPVHNMYLLIYAETGIAGVAAFFVFLVFLIRDFVHVPRRSPAYMAAAATLCGLLFVGAFDHFLWTLQQGRLLWWLMLGAVAAWPHTAA